MLLIVALYCWGAWKLAGSRRVGQNKPAESEHDTTSYGLFREYIRHEDALVNNRLTWILTIHGFLYASYGLTIQKKLEVAQRIASDVYDLSDTEKMHYLNSADLCINLARSDNFLILISFVGICINLFGFISVLAATWAIQNLRKSFCASGKLGLRSDALVVNNHATKNGSCFLTSLVEEIP